MQPRILVDENIPLAEAFFADLGQVELVPARSLTASLVKDADALIVRSVVPIDSALLKDSRVKFVGSCTAGIDHLDTAYLERRGITWHAAPGCNANSVVEYVFSALAALELDWRSLTVGIIGCGNVGQRLYGRLAGMGVPCQVYDPLLPPHPDLVDLPQVLQCPLVCLHAPLTRHGDYPSYHLLGAEQLAQLPEQGVLISAGRGAVVDNHALLTLLERRPDLRTVLDVWEGEPSINRELLAAVSLGTPHIAGYSYDGKVRGTEMIYRDYCAFLGVSPQHCAADLTQPPPQPQLAIHNPNIFPGCCQAIQQAYDVRHDSYALRQTLTGLSPGDCGAAFDQLRKDYPVRREFFNYRVHLPTSAPALSQTLGTLGFKVN